MSARRGFSLAELVVAMFLAGIIGLALTKLIVNQARFVAGQDGMLQARSASRAAIARSRVRCSRSTICGDRASRGSYGSRRAWDARAARAPRCRRLAIGC